MFEELRKIWKGTLPLFIGAAVNLLILYLLKSNLVLKSHLEESKELSKYHKCVIDELQLELQQCLQSHNKMLDWIEAQNEIINFKTNKINELYAHRTTPMETSRKSKSR